MMRKLNKREQVLLSAFISLLLITLLLNFWLTPYLAKREELEKEREQLQLQWDEIKMYKGQEAKIRNSIIQLEQERDDYRQIVLEPHLSHKYWEAILQKANDAKVEILTMEEGAISTEDKVMTASLNMQGNFEATMKFIDSLKAIPYLLAVKEGSITKAEGGIYITSLSIDYYFHE